MKIRWSGVILSLLLLLAPAGVVAQSDAGVPAMETTLPDPADVRRALEDAGIGEGAECRREARAWLSKIGDIGPAAREGFLEHVCGGQPETESRTAVDFNFEVEPESTDWLQKFAEVGGALLLYLLMFVPIWLIFRNRQQKLDEVMEGADPAFEADLSIDELKADPSRLDGIRDLIDTVCIQRTPSSSAGGSGGASMQVSYTAFVIDANGETHDILQSKDWAAVEEAAQWVADACDARLKDRTYG